MSPAFVNRLDLIVLENQMEKLTDENLSKLIVNMFILFTKIPNNIKNELDEKQQQNLEGIKSESESDEDENEENELENGNEEKKIETKEETIKKEKEFLIKEKDIFKNLFKKILPEKKEEKTSTKYSHLRTISSLNRFCYGIMKLKQTFFEKIKYEKANKTIDDIINTVLELLFRDNTEEMEISESIKDVLLEELIEKNNNKMKGKDSEKNEKYFFENSESLKKFVLTVYISSLINLYLYVVSPPGWGKNTATRTITEIRGINITSKNFILYSDSSF